MLGVHLDFRKFTVEKVDFYKPLAPAVFKAFDQRITYPSLAIYYIKIGHNRKCDFSVTPATLRMFSGLMRQMTILLGGTLLDPFPISF